MRLPLHKTKIVCTIGPASRNIPMLSALMQNGMSIARLNFSHGSLDEHSENIRLIRQSSAQLNTPVSILIDLPGTKMRLGRLAKEPLLVKKGQKIILTTRKVLGTDAILPVEYKHLTQSVSRGSIIYLNDGFIQMEAQKVSDQDVQCKVLVGGELRSHKGLNLPGAQVFAAAITKRDLEFVDFGLQNGVSIFGLSFVERAADIEKVRRFARSRGHSVCLVANT
jgi:pyruvate kinase